MANVFYCGEVTDHHRSVCIRKFTSKVSSAHLTKEIYVLSEHFACADEGAFVTERLARKLQLTRKSEEVRDI